MDHKLTLRLTVIGGQRHDDDFTVYCDGRNIGRIRLAQNHVQRRYTWRWNINPPIPLPSWAEGSSDSLDAAKAAFRETWEELYARMSPETIAHWHRADDASKEL